MKRFFHLIKIYNVRSKIDIIFMFQVYQGTYNIKHPCMNMYKCLIKMNLNHFTIFYLIVQSTNQHRNVLEITIVAVKK